VQQFLRTIGDFDRGPQRWFVADEPMSLEVEDLKGILKRGADPTEPAGEGGWTIKIWDDAAEPASWSILLHCGETREYVRNQMNVTLPEPRCVPGLYRLDSMLKLIECTVAAWDPDWCSVGPTELRRRAGRRWYDTLTSWITYLGPRLQPQIGELPESVRLIARAASGGILIVMAPSPAELSTDVIDQVRRRIGLGQGTRWGHLVKD
jgi:hypothetical protein